MHRRLSVWIVAAALVTGFVVPPGAVAHQGPAIEVRPILVNVVDGRLDDQQVRIDASLYVPSTATPADPAPVVVLAHGFGGTKEDLDALARQTAHHGYVALAYSARGFGASTGTIGLNSPDYDVKDVRQLIDALADVPEVLLDGPGDPRIGFTGQSYGGGIALMIATADSRVDAIAPRITWSSLAHALGPNNLLLGDTGLQLAPDAPVGVLKVQWASVLFGVGTLQPLVSPAGAGVVSGLGASVVALVGAVTGGADTLPGRKCLGFVAEVCRSHLASLVAGQPTEAAVEVLERSSPLPRLANVDTPTFLIQGEHDTLFNLSESVRSAEALRAGGAPVKLLWHSGGHSGPLAPGEADQGLDPDDVVNSRILNWWDHWLGDDVGVDTGPGFEFALEDESRLRYQSANAYPAFDDTVRFLSGDGRIVGETGDVAPGRDSFHSPPLGLPSAYSETSATPASLQLPAFDLPGQHLRWDGEPFADDTSLVGVPRLLNLALSSATGEAWFFAKLYDVAPDGSAELIGRQISPVRADALGAPADLALPGAAHVFEAGHHLRLVLASTDSAYANRRAADTYTVTVDLSEPARLLLPLGAALR